MVSRSQPGNARYDLKCHFLILKSPVITKFCGCQWNYRAIAIDLKISIRYESAKFSLRAKSVNVNHCLLSIWVFHRGTISSFLPVVTFMTSQASDEATSGVRGWWDGRQGAQCAQGAPRGEIFCNGVGNQRLLPDSGIACCSMWNCNCSFIEPSFNNPQWYFVFNKSLAECGSFRLCPLFSLVCLGCSFF